MIGSWNNINRIVDNSDINVKRLDNFLLACQSVLGVDNANAVKSDSIIFLAEKAKIAQNVDELVPLLLKDITDPYLYSSNLPLPYRSSLPRYFKDEAAKNKICICNGIGIIIHQCKFCHYLIYKLLIILQYQKSYHSLD